MIDKWIRYWQVIWKLNIYPQDTYQRGNHRSVICSLEFQPKKEELEPKLHKCPNKQRYIAGSSKCSTKPLLKLLTHII